MQLSFTNISVLCGGYYKKPIFIKIMDRIEKLKEYLKASPNDSFLKHALGLEYIKLNNDLQAKELFENILEYQPGYVGTYYHLAKLLERQGDTNNAMMWYEKGMAMAKKAGDQHSYNELQAGYDDLLP